MAIYTLWFWQDHIRNGLKLRNHRNAEIRRRNRARVRWAISKIRMKEYYR